MAGSAEALAEAYRAAGYGAGQRVGLLLENRPSYFRHWLALNAIGVSVVPINPDYRAAEIEYLVGHSEIVAAVAIGKRQDEIRAAAGAIGRTVAVFGPDDAPVEVTAARGAGANGCDAECALLYTSGTTGRPKGCVLTNTYFLNSGRWYDTIGGYVTLAPGAERMITPLPLFHMNAMATSTLAMVVSGGCLTVLDRFHPKSWWESVRQSRATILHYLGVMPPMLMAAPESEDDRRHCVRFGFGAGIDKRLHAPFEQRFGFPLIEAWAMTETGGGVVIAATREPRHVGTSCFGRLDEHSEARIVREDGSDADPGEPGELLVRRKGADPRHGFFAEYLKDPQATAEAWAGGWFHTGDVVKRDAEGSFYFVDRKKNVIRRSGENIAAVEVESVLLQHEGVQAAAVAPVADDVRGEEVLACIVARRKPADSEARERLAKDIVGWCLARLAYYKAPGHVVFVDSLPLTSTQKIQRGAMKDFVARVVGKPECIDLRHLKKRTA
jgi:acyl-CoA synthetase (AMP-forming)/AMP-acid ligase II